MAQDDEAQRLRGSRVINDVKDSYPDLHFDKDWWLEVNQKSTNFKNIGTTWKIVKYIGGGEEH